MQSFQLLKLKTCMDRNFWSIWSQPDQIFYYTNRKYCSKYNLLKCMKSMHTSNGNKKDYKNQMKQRTTTVLNSIKIESFIKTRFDMLKTNSSFRFRHNYIFSIFFSQLMRFLPSRKLWQFFSEKWLWLVNIVTDSFCLCFRNACVSLKWFVPFWLELFSFWKWNGIRNVEDHLWSTELE